MYLTATEKKAIATLEKLSRKWPETLWLFAASGSLEIHKYDKDGCRRVKENGSMDADACVALVRIPCDGGDY